MENKVEEETGRWPCTLLLILEHSEEVSFSPARSSSTQNSVPDRHTRVLLQLNRRSVEPRSRARQRQDRSLHEQNPWKTEMRRQRGRRETCEHGE